MIDDTTLEGELFLLSEEWRDLIFQHYTGHSRRRRRRDASTDVVESAKKKKGGGDAYVAFAKGKGMKEGCKYYKCATCGQGRYRIAVTDGTRTELTEHKRSCPAVGGTNDRNRSHFPGYKSSWTGKKDVRTFTCKLCGEGKFRVHKGDQENRVFVSNHAPGCVNSTERCGERAARRNARTNENRPILAAF